MSDTPKTITAHMPPFDTVKNKWDHWDQVKVDSDNFATSPVYEKGYPSYEAVNTPSEISYKYNEGELLNEVTEYVNSTYSQHYSKNKHQATEFIIDAGHGDGFAIGSIMKYAQRYGNKDGYNRKDIMKIIHYGLIQLYIHDLAGRGK